ncbi:MAG: tRNA (guanosine(46)-N7)-methyltransferase TrmB [Spirulinaceae cyanobacterium]
MARFRVRQHVNPLSQKYQTPAAPPQWQEVYQDPTQPLHLDIGSGWGNFLLAMAQLHKDVNFLGLEIRKPLVNKANYEKEQLGLNNLHFLFCNVNNSLGELLSSLPTQGLQCVTIQFPDPWFKRKHIKRRVIQPELVDILAQFLMPGGKVFLQSDVEAMTKEMRQCFDKHPDFKQQHEEVYLAENPFPPTAREAYTLKLGKPVYRALIIKH